jgi:hypothetical protein
MQVDRNRVVGLIRRALRAGSRNGKRAQQEERQPEAIAAATYR